MSHLLDESLQTTLKKDKAYLENTQLPIITVSATYKEDLKGLHGLPELDVIPDIVFSRAHYSMALGVAIQKWQTKIDPQKSWVVDPTNYVSSKDWFSIVLTEKIGKTLARNKFLKKLKGLVDKFGRNKLPILDSIAPPLIYLTENIKRPILSFHIAAGNILVERGKRVFQVITDPHVREDYLKNAENPNIKFCVFDERTKADFIEKATILGKKINPDKVIVTGPPIDPRIIKIRAKKKAWRNGCLRLCLATGGLGTNKYEIKDILKQLLHHLCKKDHKYQIMVYAGTQKDLRDMVIRIAKNFKVKLKEIQTKDPAEFYPQAEIDQKHFKLSRSPLTLIYHPQIVDANELLIHYGFPWADGFISKPSGDMAYDAVAAGCFLLTLNEWGEWEHNIREIFEQKNIARKAQQDQIVAQLAALTSAAGKAQSWVETAMHSAATIDKLFLKGSENIIKAYQKILED